MTNQYLQQIEEYSQNLSDIVLKARNPKEWSTMEYLMLSLSKLKKFTTRNPTLISFIEFYFSRETEDRKKLVNEYYSENGKGHEV
ncbi:hypothetical protein SNEBB_007563 [Seison nebaliae]|nr:hypothetical protein SNEBB_007563 [Seison nebaliae]